MFGIAFQKMKQQIKQRIVSIESTIIKVCIIVILFYCILPIRNVFAQTEQFKFKRLDISKGLTYNETNTIFKDSYGFIWVGTGFGLNRFDGFAVKSFT